LSTLINRYIGKGAQHMLLASFYFALMNIFIKAVTHLPAMEVVFFRCGISLLLCIYYIKKENIDWKGTNRKLLMLRGVFGTASLFAYIVTIAHMPLATAITVQYLSPIFTTILAIFVLNERVRPIQWFFFLISFAGVLVMKGFDDRVEILFLTVGILSALGSACAYVTIRSLKQMENPFVVVLHFQLIGTVTGLTFSSFNFVMPQGMDWINLLMVGIFTQLGQVNMTQSLQLEKIAKVSILNYTGVVYATAAGFLIFGEHYSLGTLAGIALVIVGMAMSLLQKK
jgi:drug/metabolite transporter (DMT)-like permease